jgi:hypothetical protein
MHGEEVEQYYCPLKYPPTRFAAAAEYGDASNLHDDLADEIPKGREPHQVQAVFEEDRHVVGCCHLSGL